MAITISSSMFARSTFFAALVLSSVVHGFSTQASNSFVGRRMHLGEKTGSSSSLSMSTGLYFATIGGNTKRCAELIAEAAGIEKICEIEDLPNTDELLAHDSLIIGAPTWNTGAEKQRSMTGWDEWLYNVLPTLDLKGKKVCFFGMGDQVGYPFNYCDAVGELYDQFAQRGCEVTFGRIPMEGYRFVNSKAQVEGKEDTLYGLLFDEDNQNDLSPARAQEWVGQLKEEGFM